MFIILFLTSCSLGLKRKGSVQVENGMNQKVSINYEIINSKDSTKLLLKEDFIKIVNQASNEARLSCKYKPTYEPFEVILLMNNDTVKTIVNFRAKNGFGVPNEESKYAKFRGTELFDSF